MGAGKAAAKHRMAQWAQILQTRISSGQSITDFCTSSGISKNTYYYWQRKLRESASGELAKIEPEVESQIAPKGWARLEATKTARTETEITIEVGGCRVAVTDGTDSELLVKVCRILKAL